MVVGPIGTYFLTVDTVFKGLHCTRAGGLGAWLIGYRELYVCGGFGGHHGERGVGRVCGRCLPGGSDGGSGGGGEGEGVEEGDVGAWWSRLSRLPSGWDRWGAGRPGSRRRICRCSV